MKLEEAISKVINQRSLTDIFEVIDAIKVHCKIRRNDDFIVDKIEEVILERGITDIWINYDEECLVYREQLFQNTSFRIQLAPDEINQKQLVFGHRFLPYVNPRIHPSEVFLIDEDDNEIEMFESTVSLQENFIYFSMLPPYGLEHYDIDADGNIKILAYDLSAWMQKHGMTPDDNLLISPINYEKNIFRIEKLSHKAIKRQKIADAQKDELLESVLFDQFEMSEDMLPVDMQLFHAMGYFSEKERLQMGTPLGAFVTQHEHIQIFNTGPYAFLNTLENLEDSFEMAMDDAMYPDLDAMGTATDIQGVFQEMGISYTEEFVKGKMIEQLHLNQSIDQQAIRKLLLKFGDESFYNEAQKENFDKALNKLAESVTAEWKNKRLSPAHQQLLKNLLLLKTDVIGLLRDIDNQLTSPDSFDFSLLFQIQPYEQISDTMLEALVNPKKEETGQKLVADWSTQVKKMREEFVTTRKNILDQI